MKRIAAVFIIALLLFSFASADELMMFKTKYNGFASVFNVPKIDKYIKSNGIYLFSVTNTLGIMAQLNENEIIDAVGVYCDSDDEYKDFLFMSLAILYTYGETDTTTLSLLIMQLLNIQTGKTNDTLPTSKFGGITVMTMDNYKYLFIYTPHII